MRLHVIIAPSTFDETNYRTLKEGGKGGGGWCIDHVSRKIKENILENHGSRRLWKSRFARKKKSHFTFHGEIKRANNGSRKYPLPPS